MALLPDPLGPKTMSTSPASILRHWLVSTKYEASSSLSSSATRRPMVRCSSRSRLRIASPPPGPVVQGVPFHHGTVKPRGSLGREHAAGGPGSPVAFAAMDAEDGHAPADRAGALADRLLQDAIGALELYTVYLGERLGLYRALADGGPATSAELAGRTGTAERYIREWLRAPPRHRAA